MEQRKETKMMRLAEEITFGVEIETTLPHGTCDIGGYHRGCQIVGLPEGWNAQYDSSIHTTRPGYQGVEIVSPILKGVDGLEQIVTVCNWLQANNAHPNRSCGLHVHVGWPHEDLPRLRNLINLVANYEEALFGVTGTPWRKFEGHYASPIKDKVKRNKFQLKGGTIRETRFSWQRTGTGPRRIGDDLHSVMQYRNDYICQRYQSLNINNLLGGNRQTVEFRCFAGTTSAAKIIGYVQMCLALVQMAENAKKAPRVEFKAQANSNPDTNAGFGGMKVRDINNKPAEFNINRFFYYAGWFKNRNATSGIIEDSPITKKEMMKELRRLATQYDARLRENYSHTMAS